MCLNQLENISYSLVGLNLLGVEDVDGNALEPYYDPGGWDIYNRAPC